MDNLDPIPTLSAPVRFTLSKIPTETDFDDRDSSFFQRHNQLPSPQTVRLQAQAQYIAGTTLDKRKKFYSDGPNVHPPPALFESLGLFVKWGSGFRVAEGQSLYAVRHCLQGAVPVPEIYGWRKVGDEVFLYMEAIKGRTLEEVWDELVLNDRLSICNELRKIITNLRWLKQDSKETFVGSVSRGYFYDRAIHPRYMEEAGPFTSVEAFHSWFTFLCRRPMPDPYSIPLEPFRQHLPDDCEIVFTHGDLHRSNILVSTSNPPKVIAIVDWEQAGWLPVYWEDRKAHWTAEYKGEWAVKYLPMILDQHTETWDAWDYYTSSMGP